MHYNNFKTGKLNNHKIINLTVSGLVNRLKEYFMKILILILLGIDLFAATTISAGAMSNFENALVSWLSGSLGYIIALLGMLGTIVYYMLFVPSSGNQTNGMAFLFYGMMISLFAGGVVGISKTMMGIGAGSF